MKRAPLPKLARELHLMLAAFVAPFLLVYIVSALLMEVPFFKIKPGTESNFEVVQGANRERTVEAVAALLKAERGISGEITGRHQEDGAVRFDARRLGTEWKVSLPADSDRIRVEERVGNAFYYLDRIHRHSGLRHGAIELELWGLVAGGVAASLLIFGASGIYLWFLMVKERRIGILLLGGHAIVTCVVLALVRLA